MSAHPLHSLSVQRKCAECERKNRKVDGNLTKIRDVIRGLNMDLDRIQRKQNGGNSESDGEEVRGRTLKRDRD